MRSSFLPLVLAGGVLILVRLPLVAAHAGIVQVSGANGIIGYVYGIDPSGKFPRRVGEPGDAGGDCAVFEANVASPQPPCGRTGELGNLDTDEWLSKSEQAGIPSAFPNGSVVATAFQVDRDGAGPMWCEFSKDASLNDWANMTMFLSPAGNFGDLDGADRTNQTIVTGFPTQTTCVGGTDKNVCVVRCRTGVQKEYGGCFAVRLSNPTFVSNFVKRPSVNPGSDMASRSLHDQVLSRRHARAGKHWLKRVLVEEQSP